MSNRIDMSELTGGLVLNLAGHDRGLAARELFKVAELDRAGHPVEVTFPENFRQVSSSFFQGMFSESVRFLGSVENFFAHYLFNAPAHVRAKLVDYAEQTLKRQDY
ncbi:hypothetical protein [Sphingosinicella sp.]|uniref:hypothetical protein n=1 Tax=Sphingosinicella sp. TaxID=1917971 RepID=UPI0035B0876C